MATEKSFWCLQKVVQFFVRFVKFNNFFFSFTGDENGAPDSDAFAVFEKWLIDNGSHFPKLELRVGDSFYYIILQCDRKFD